MNKIFAGVVAAILSFNAFSAAASTVKEDTWVHVKNEKAMMVLNVNKAGDILSFNCEKGIGAWIALESRFVGSIIVPDNDPHAITVELLVVDSNDQLVRWTKDDLDFNKPNGAGQQRVQKLFESLHTAKKVEALINGETVEKFVGAPSVAFPNYSEIAGFCKL